MRRWLDIPLCRHSGRKDPTWGSVAERYGQCSGRVALYVAKRVHDRVTFERIVSETLERNVDLLLVEEHDELEELRRLRATADRLIASSGAPSPGSRAW